jgi:hypothetical protein
VGSITRIANGRVFESRHLAPRVLKDRKHHVRRVCLNGEAEV